MSEDNVPGGFKVTEIGTIPQEWSVSTIGDHCEVITGGTPRTEKAEYYDPPEVPWIKSAEVNKGTVRQVETFISKNGLENSNARMLPRDSVIIALAGRGKTRGMTAILQIECACNQSVACIVPNIGELDYRFVHYYLKSRYDHIRNLTGNEDRSGLNLALVRKIRMPVPPLQEQMRIADALSAVESAKEKTEATITTLKELKKSMMKHLFKYGPVSLADSSGVVRKDTEVGEFPAHWQVSDLGELVDIFDNRRIPVREDERAKQKKVYPYCGANGIIDYVEDYLFEGEHLLFAEDGGDWGPFAQSSYIMDGRFWVNNHAHILRAREKMTTNLYLMHALNYLDLTSLVTGDARGKINQATLRHIRIPMPPLNEQKRISLMLETVTQAVKTEEDRTDSLTKTFNTLLGSLMTGKLRVNNLEVPT